MGVVYQKQAGIWVELPGYVSTPSGTMSAQEFYRWQVRAALLDPLAYQLVVGAAQSLTVPAGETWYLVDGWFVDTGSGGTLYHRKPDAANENAIPLLAGETVTTETVATAHFLLCKPPVVIGADPRYTNDPKGLFFERLYRLDAELTHYDLGHNNTGAGVLTSTLPTDFTYGMVVHISAHDVAWCGLYHSSTTLTLNLNNEVSDTDRLRFSERMTVPFTRAQFPQVSSRGVSESEGTCNVRYVKLPSDW